MRHAPIGRFWFRRFRPSVERRGRRSRRFRRFGRFFLRAVPRVDGGPPVGRIPLRTDDYRPTGRAQRVDTRTGVIAFIGFVHLRDGQQHLRHGPFGGHVRLVIPRHVPG